MLHLAVACPATGLVPAAGSAASLLCITVKWLPSASSSQHVQTSELMDASLQSLAPDSARRMEALRHSIGKAKKACRTDNSIDRIATCGAHVQMIKQQIDLPLDNGNHWKTV